jgi:hypothetical protein
MSLKTELVAAATAYCVLRNVALASLASAVAKDGKFFIRLERGGDCTTAMYERFFAYFAAAGVPDPVAELERQAATADPRQLDLVEHGRDVNTPPRTPCGRASGADRAHQGPVPRAAWSPAGEKHSTGNGPALRETPEDAAAPTAATTPAGELCPAR